MVRDEAVVLLIIKIVSSFCIINNETNRIPFPIASAAITHRLRKSQTSAGATKASARHDPVLLIPQCRRRYLRRLMPLDWSVRYLTNRTT